MKSRVTLSIALLIAFVAGAVLVTPVARAVEAAVTPVLCKAKALGCVTAINKTGAGVVGVSGSAAGSTSTPPPGTGVVGSGTKFGSVDISTNGDGVVGIAGTPVSGATVPGIGVIGTGPSEGVAGTSSQFGIAGVSTGAATAASAGATIENLGSNALTSTAIAALAPTGAMLFEGFGTASQTTPIIAIDGSGNITTAGKITTSGSCHTGCSIHHQIASYATTSAAPQLEDMGEAQLLHGAAFVRLDPAFANAIDARSYFVLITPEAATDGLYVAQRTPGGFLVRENLNGHSSGPFAYRIVAHPFGDRSPRLPIVEHPDVRLAPTR